MAKRRKKPLLARMKKKADKALSEYIRAETKSSFGKCPLCQVGEVECCFHFIRRRRLSLRWDERNVVGACHRCNYVEYRDPDLSRAWFLRTFGVARYLELVDESKMDFKPSVPYLQGIVLKYEYRLRQFTEGKGGDTDKAADTAGGRVSP